MMSTSNTVDRVQYIPDARRGFALYFSACPLPGNQFEFERCLEQNVGHWYFSASHGMEGWPCPALLKYFDEALERLYILAKRVS